MTPTPREICPRCRRPAKVCYCSHLTTLPSRTRVLVLQHPRERYIPIGTARMATLCLENSQLRVGFNWAEDPVVQAALADSERPTFLLFPGPEARDVTTCSFPAPITLIVIDGTWAQVRKVLRHNPQLSNLPRISFTPTQPSDYRIRLEPNEQCVSTIEALAHVLGVLEGDPEQFQALTRPFRAMVDTQVDFTTRMNNPWRRRKKVEEVGEPD